MLGAAAFYFISAGLITAGIASGVLPENLHAPLILIWALAGIGLAGAQLLKED
jgi:hypothetical protein